MWIKNEKSGVLFSKMFSVFLVKLFNTTRGINQFLFAREKRMAGRADFDIYGLVNRSKFNFVTAGTSRCNLMISGMNIRFHYVLNLQKTCSQHAAI